MNKVQKIVKIILCSYMSVKVCQYFQKIIKKALTEKKPNKKQAVAPEKSLDTGKQNQIVILFLQYLNLKN